MFRFLPACLVILLTSASACSPARHRRSADLEVDGEIRAALDSHPELASGSEELVSAAEGADEDAADADRFPAAKPIPLVEIGTAGFTEDFAGVPAPEPTSPGGPDADTTAPESGGGIRLPPGIRPGEPLDDGDLADLMAAGIDPEALTVSSGEASSGEASERATASEGTDEAVESADGGAATAADSESAPGGTDPEADAEFFQDATIQRVSVAEIARKVPARLLSLREAVRLAFANNRELQSQRESVYLSGLALTLTRFEFAPRFFGVVTGSWDHSNDGENSGRVDTNVGMTKVFTNGARLSLNLLQNFFQFFTGNRREVARTIAEAGLTMPILRGFGRKIVEEPLIQSERNLVYQIRSFHRFRQTFAVRVVSEYLRVLQERDRIENEYNNWHGLVENRARVDALAAAGRLGKLEVDQARQQELQAEDRYSAAVEQYESVVDDFKITLGISIDEAIALDPAELGRLVDDGVSPIDVTLEQAVDAAGSLRFDLLTARDQLDDARREIDVRIDALRTQLDLDADVALPSGEGSGQKPFRFNAGNVEYGFGFRLDLPFDRKSERNAYVSSLIAFEREQRDLSLFEDNVRLTIRDALRALEREIVSYPIQRASVDLAADRVASTTTLRQAGRASTRDVLESQSALIEARNALTRSLINYKIARLQFFRDVGAIAIRSDGSVVEERIKA